MAQVLNCSLEVRDFEHRSYYCLYEDRKQNGQPSHEQTSKTVPDPTDQVSDTLIL